MQNTMKVVEEGPVLVAVLHRLEESAGKRPDLFAAPNLATFCLIVSETINQVLEQLGETMVVRFEDAA